MKIKNEGIKNNEEMVAKAPVAKKELSLEEKIAVWKAAHGRIYKNTIDGESIIWRAVKRGEYKQGFLCGSLCCKWIASSC